MAGMKIRSDLKFWDYWKKKFRVVSGCALIITDGWMRLSAKWFVGKVIHTQLSEKSRLHFLKMRLKYFNQRSDCQLFLPKHGLKIFWFKRCSGFMSIFAISPEKMIIEEDTLVILTYVVKDKSGQVLDDTHACSPVICRIGQRELPEGLEKRIIGLKPGDRKIFEVRPEQGYGKRQGNLVKRVRLSDLPDDAGEPEVGKQYRRLNTLMETEVYRVVGFLEDWVFLDGNHPFAGMTLQYEVTIVDVHIDSPDA